MHIVTKILIVVAAVLSVLLAALTMAYSVNADTILTSYTNERAQREANESSMHSQLTIADEQQAKQTAKIADLNNAKSRAIENLNSLEQENASLEQARREAEVSRDSIQNKIAELSETAKTQAELIKAYRKEVTDLRDRELTFRRREIDLLDRLNDLISQNEVLTQAGRAYQEQLAEMTRERDAIASGPGADAGDEAAYTVSGPPIRGRVVQVKRDDATGKLLAQIDVGTNDRVRKNMLLYAIRGNDTFLANLKVLQTDLNWAIVEINTLNRNVEVKPNDLVVSTLQ